MAFCWASASRSTVDARCPGQAVVFVPQGAGDLLRQLVVQAVDQVADVVLDVAHVQVLPAPVAGIEDVQQVAEDLDDGLAAGQRLVAEMAGPAALGVRGDDGLGDLRQALPSGECPWPCASRLPLGQDDCAWQRPVRRTPLQLRHSAMPSTVRPGRRAKFALLFSFGRPRPVNRRQTPFVARRPRQHRIWRTPTHAPNVRDRAFGAGSNARETGRKPSRQ